MLQMILELGYPDQGVTLHDDSIWVFVEGYEDTVVDYCVTRSIPGESCNISCDREDLALVGDEFPDGITSLRRDQSGILNTSESLQTH